MAEPWRDSPDNYVTDPSGKRIGLNWDNIRQTFMKNASPDELAAQIRKMKMPTPAEPVKPANALTEKQINLICDYYRVGNKIPWIAKELKMAEATVRKYLVEREVYIPGRDRSRK
jgi:hypothetical protein